MPVPKLTIEEFSKSIKTKYPQYQNVPDRELVDKIVAKYPTYRDKVNLDAGIKNNYEQNAGSTQSIRDVYAQINQPNDDIKMAAGLKGKMLPIDPNASYMSAPASEGTRVEQPRQTQQKVVAVENQIARDEKIKRDTPVALRNSAKQYFENNKVKVKDGSPVLEQKVNELQEKLNDGDLVLYYDKMGNPKMGRNMGFFSSLGQGFIDAIKHEKQSDELLSMSDRDAIKYLNDKEKESDEYLKPIAQQGSLGYTLGSGGPLMAKAITGAVVGTGLAAVAPETAGLSLAGLPAFTSFLFTAPALAKSGYTNSLERRYFEGKQQGLSDEQALEKAKTQALVGEATELATGAILSKLPVVNSSGAGVKNALTQVVKNEAKNVGLLGATAAGGSLARSGAASAAGYEDTASQALSEAWESGTEMMKVGAAMFMLTHPTVVPKFVHAQVKEFLSKAPKEQIAASVTEAVEKGVISPEQGERALSDMQSYNEARSKVPGGLSEEKSAAITGLLEKKANLEKQKSTVDEAFHEDYDAQIKAIDGKIKEIKDSENPVTHEVDELTGESGSGVTVIKPEQNKSPNVVGSPEYVVNKTKENVSVIKPHENTGPNVIETIKSKENAEAIPSNEGAIPEGGIVNEVSQNKGVKNIQQPTEPTSKPAKTEQQDESIIPKDILDYNKSLREKKPGIDLNADRVGKKPTDNILYYPDRMYRNIGTGGYEDFILSGKIRAKQESKQSYTEAFFNKGTTDARYSKGDGGKYIVEAVSNENWKPDASEKYYRPDSELTKDSPIRIFEQQPDGSYKVVYDNIKDAALLPETKIKEQSLTHASTEAKREELGLPERNKKKRKSVAELKQQADEAIKSGENIESLIEKGTSGKGLEDVEHTILTKYAAELDSKLQKDILEGNQEGVKEALKEIERVYTASERSGSTLGSALQARKNKVVVDDSLSDFFIKEQESLGIKNLNEEQNKQVLKEFEEYKLLKEEADKRIKEFEETIQKQEVEIAKLKAESVIESEIKNASKKRSKKTKQDFTQERKDILAKMREDLLKTAKGASGSLSTIPGAPQLAAIAPHVAKLVKSFAEEGLQGLETFIDKVHEEIKDIVPGITKKNVSDIIGGEYSIKKATRNELAEMIRNLRIEASLLKQIEKEKLGIREEASVAVKNNKTRRIEELEARLKDIKKINKDKEALGDGDVVNEQSGEIFTDEQLNKERYKKTLNQIEKVKKQISEGDFDVEPVQKPVAIMDAKTQAAVDALAEYKRKLALKRAKNEFDKKTRIEKIAYQTSNILGLKRLLQSAVDYSVPLRQDVLNTLNPIKIKETGEAFANMFSHSISPKRFKRFMDEIHKDGTESLLAEMGVELNKPDELNLNKRDEDFRSSILDQIRNSKFYRENTKFSWPLRILEPVFASERASASFLNTRRIIEARKYSEYLKQNGITLKNDPEAYRQAGKFIMNITGRGNMLSIIENSPKAKTLIGNTFYGGRLMASRFNILNPMYYKKMPREIRVRAFQDMALAASGMSLIAATLIASGAKVSLDPDTPDFMQYRFKDKVYDITGGYIQYVRTFFRLINAAYHGGKAAFGAESEKNAAKVGQKAGKSSLRFFQNKLAPNTSFAVNFLTGSDSYGNPYDPTEFFKFYPMYADDLVEGLKKDGGGALLTIGIPSLFGAGVNVYDTKKKK